MKFLIGLASLLLLSSCASLTGYQTGRTVGENNWEILASLNASQSPEFLDIEIDSADIINRIGFPNIELGGRYGITEDLDIGLRMNSNFNMMADVKYQVAGGKDQPVALAVGGGVATFGLFSALWNVQIPVYCSIHPSEKFSISIMPRYIYQFTAGDLGLTGVSYVGGNLGILVGKSPQFGIDIGYYNFNPRVVETETIAIRTVGFGMKFPISGK